MFPSPHELLYCINKNSLQSEIQSKILNHIKQHFPMFGTSYCFLFVSVCGLQLIACVMKGKRWGWLDLKKKRRQYYYTDIIYQMFKNKYFSHNTSINRKLINNLNSLATRSQRITQLEHQLHTHSQNCSNLSKIHNPSPSQFPSPPPSQLPIQSPSLLSSKQYDHFEEQTRTNDDSDARTLGRSHEDSFESGVREGTGVGMVVGEEEDVGGDGDGGGDEDEDEVSYRVELLIQTNIVLTNTIQKQSEFIQKLSQTPLPQSLKLKLLQNLLKQYIDIYCIRRPELWDICYAVFIDLFQMLRNQVSSGGEQQEDKNGEVGCEIGLFELD